MVTSIDPTWLADQSWNSLSKLGTIRTVIWCCTTETTCGGVYYERQWHSQGKQERVSKHEACMPKLPRFSKHTNTECKKRGSPIMGVGWWGGAANLLRVSFELSSYFGNRTGIGWLSWMEYSEWLGELELKCESRQCGRLVRRRKFKKIEQLEPEQQQRWRSKRARMRPKETLERL